MPGLGAIVHNDAVITQALLLGHLHPHRNQGAIASGHSHDDARQRGGQRRCVEARERGKEEGASEREKGGRQGGGYTSCTFAIVDNMCPSNEAWSASA